MKLLNLTAALFLGGVLQAQNPLPAIHPQPQEVTLSTNRLKAPHGFTLSGMQHPDEDAMRLIRQTLSITDNSEDVYKRQLLSRMARWVFLSTD